MKVLIIGGTGLISQGIVKHLLQRKADITLFNRNKLENPFGDQVKTIAGDRLQFATFEREMNDKSYDVVIDMICFKPAEAESDVRAFANKCKQFIFCSTVCTYGSKIPANVLIDENFPQEPISEYGREKVACEKIFQRAHDAGQFKLTTIRPSHTYGPGGMMIDQLDYNASAWDRIEKGKPVLCAGDGLGLWQSTHRDDVGRLFAYATMNPKTFGESYNATRDEVLTWRDYHTQVAAAFGKTASMLFMPASWIVSHDPKRFGLLQFITQFHGAYTSEKAKRDVPEFAGKNIPLTQGAAETFRDIRQRGKWRNSDEDSIYEQMVRKAIEFGIAPVTA